MKELAVMFQADPLFAKSRLEITSLAWVARFFTVIMKALTIIFRLGKLKEKVQKWSRISWSGDDRSWPGRLQLGVLSSGERCRKVLYPDKQQLGVTEGGLNRPTRFVPDAPQQPDRS